MSKVKEMTTDELEHFIEQKLLQILGDPDSGLQLKPEFKKKLKARLNKAKKRMPTQKKKETDPITLLNRAYEALPPEDRDEMDVWDCTIKDGLGNE